MTRIDLPGATAEADSAPEAARRVVGNRGRGGAFDRRLLRYTKATRRFLLLSVAIGAASALVVVVQAWLIATVVARAFVEHESLRQSKGPLFALLAVVVSRAVLSWGAEMAAHRASASAKSELRRAVVGRIAEMDPARLERHDKGGLIVTVTGGMDALDVYFARYIPQVFLAVIVPVAVIAVIAGADWISALIIAVTVPLIPIFMGLIGATTGERTAKRMRSLERLSGHFLDVVAGLPTLKVFGRAKAQARAIAEVTDQYRQTTMSTLRLTFLSSLALELLATVSVALVAVAVGLRLLGGHMSFHDALFVLVLTPEAYLPLRQLAANFHSSADGMKAAGQAFALLQDSEHGRSRRTRRSRSDMIEVLGLEVTYPGRFVPAVCGFDLVVEPGETVVVAGPSGCGKSTVLSVLLGLRRPDSGSVRIGGVDLEDLDLDAWRARVGWLPQRPHIFARSLAQNVRIGTPQATAEQVEAAVEAAGLGNVVQGLHDGVDTQLGEGGFGLSAGERQRLALARMFLRDPSILLLDEPTANLDSKTEADVMSAVRRLAQGRSAIVVSHRPALTAVADRVVTMGAPVAVL